LGLKISIEKLVSVLVSHMLQMAELAQACTQDDPNLRPTMRSVVVDLIALSSMTNNSDMAS